MSKAEETLLLKFDPNLRWLFTEVPMLDRYEAAAKAGFKGVEVAFPYTTPAKEIADRLQDNGLTMVQILSPFNWDAGERGYAALPGHESQFRQSVEMAREYAAQIGRPMVHIMPGNMPAGIDLQACQDLFVRNIQWAARLLAEENITVILEPCCRARFPDFLYHRLEEGARVIDAVGAPNVKLCFDTYHVQSEEGSITEKLKQYWPYIGHMQIGNVPIRQEPGPGEIHFPYLFAQIEAMGWDRWIGCEFSPSGPTLECLEWGRPYGIGI